ncbi:hypothetical protein G7046_g2591 [Stylonectria norvegica]|nr:hypothetical protein G7046_g2591 [Stylonectria norvegica]
MAYPPQYREPPPSIPSIIVPSADRFRSRTTHHDMGFGGRSPAVSIPGLHEQDNVPPPLPPPPYLPGNEPPQHHQDMKPRRDYGPSAASFASGYGSMASSFAEDRPSYMRRDMSSMLGDRDEGYASYSSTGRSRDSPRPAEFGLHHNRYQFQSPAEIHGDNMKAKLNPSHSFDRSPPRSLLSASMSEMQHRRTPSDSRIPPALSVPVQLPIHTRNILDSPARLTETPLHSAISPRSALFGYGDHSPNDSSDVDRSPRSRSRRNNSDDATSTKSYDFSEDMEMEETQSLKRLRIDDPYKSGCQKRRAASPPDEHLMASHPDVLRRRDLGSRGSPTPRLGTIPQGTSISSLSSASHSNSYMSGLSMPASSIVTANSYGRRSPTNFSPGGISPTSCTSPYNTPVSLNPSPRTSISGRGSIHTRTVSATSPRKLTEVQKLGGPKIQGFLMCECCPKKPKKFETAEELNAHEAEKQYECSFCGNRFKNKNEAERHQNSLHVRRHSWSCSALSHYDRAFHESTNRPGEADCCGYCGDEFPRSGRGPEPGALSGGNAPRHATNQDLEERIRHLQEVHKFRECNSSKKFFRADHFRQHLKHSHAGTSGKWTNMLETACMLEEDPTPRKMEMGSIFDAELWTRAQLRIEAPTRDTYDCRYDGGVGESQEDRATDGDHDSNTSRLWDRARSIRRKKKKPQSPSSGRPQAADADALRPKQINVRPSCVPSSPAVKSGHSAATDMRTGNANHQDVIRRDALATPHKHHALPSLDNSKKAAEAASSQAEAPETVDDSKPTQWEEVGHKFANGELEALKQSIAEMALSKIDGQDDLYVGGIWALRRSDSLSDRHITHVLSVVGFNPNSLKNFKDEPWGEYGKHFKHLVIDIDDVEDADLLVHLPKAVQFIHDGLKHSEQPDVTEETDDQDAGGAKLNKGLEELKISDKGKTGGVFVHCAAGKSRSVAATIAYLLWRYPNRFNPDIVSDPTVADQQPPSKSEPRSRKETADEAVRAALTYIQRTRPMAEPNPGFMDQLSIWWEMGCPENVEDHPLYQRWTYKREVEENVAIGQAPTRLRFEDEESQSPDESGHDSGLSLRCRKCRCTLATGPFIKNHKPFVRPGRPTEPCQHYIIEPLSWMRSTLEKGELNGRLICPNAKCGAGVGRYDWKGFRCSCGAWIIPAFSLQKGKVDDAIKRTVGPGPTMGLRMPPGAGPRGGNL